MRGRGMCPCKPETQLNHPPEKRTKKRGSDGQQVAIDEAGAQETPQDLWMLRLSLDRIPGLL